MHFYLSTVLYGVRLANSKSVEFDVYCSWMSYTSSQDQKATIIKPHGCVHISMRKSSFAPFVSVQLSGFGCVFMSSNAHTSIRKVKYRLDCVLDLLLLHLRFIPPYFQWLASSNKSDSKLKRSVVYVVETFCEIDHSHKFEKISRC